MYNSFIKYLLLIILVNVLTNNLFSKEIKETDDNIYLSEQSDEDRVKTLLVLSDSFKNNNPEKALVFAKKAYNFSKKHDYDKGVVNSMLRISKIYWGMSDYKQAMEYAEKSKELAKNLDYQKELAKAYRMCGMVYADIENHKKSSEAFYQSLKIYEQIGDKLGIEEALGDIGSVNFHQLNFDKALEFFNLSLQMARKQNNLKGIARGLNNVAAVYEAINDYEKATKYFEEANKINKQLGNKQREAINNMNLGITYMNLNKYDKSLYYFSQADSLFIELTNLTMQIKCWIGYANYYFSVGDDKSGIKYATRALDKAKALDNKNFIYDATDILNKLYLSRKDTSNAYKYMQIKYLAKDSLRLKENRLNLTKHELEYEFAKKEEKAKHKQQRNKLYVSLLIISLLIILIIIILVLLNQRIKTKNALIEQQNLEHELEMKNKEMTTNVMSLMKKNEMLSILSNKLIELKNKAVKPEVKQAVTKIALELQKTADAEIYKEFEYRFNQIHVGFYDKLLKDYPDLTPGELRLCAFLRLNMSTKDISELTGQVPSSLETARYRLRKKLGISNTKENLITFLTKY